jgi:alanyl-tRNA synthetase
VIARWRNDVDYVAAGIFCFQPYCVTGEMEPPANPLICPQFCLRFNDLDNIGLTGRHYSGFVMIGIQVFNKPDKFIFFKDECVEFNYRWLTEELKIDPEEITFIEDIWAGGGNLGPFVEYFIHGLEVGNMVFMQYKYDHQGKTEELPVKVIDVGIGLERIPWLINGSPTSYFDVFTEAFSFMRQKTEIPLHNDVWEKIGPYSCLLNIDEVENIDKTWEEISKLIDLPVEKVKESITPLKDLYVVLDHTRTVLVIIMDGGLPSNTGGGSNCRNVLRRVFALLKKYGWWEKIGELEGLLQLFECHKKDLAQLYGPFAEYKSFRDIITIEYERWSSTEGGQKKKLEQLVSKNKGKLSLDQWIMVIQSWGIPADAIS